MVYENNLPKIETIYEIKEQYKIPSYEEFMKTYQTDEANEFLAEAEYQDQVLHGPRYGPGNGASRMSHDEQKVEVLQKVGAGLLAISYFTPAAAFTVPLTISAGVVGGAAEVIGHAADNDDAKKVGGFFRGLAIDAAADGVASGSLSAGKTARDVAKVYVAASNGIDKARGFS